MRKQIFVPLRYRSDTSVYLHKNILRRLVRLFLLATLILGAVSGLEPADIVRAQHTEAVPEINQAVTANGMPITIGAVKAPNQLVTLLTGETVLREQPSVPPLWPVQGKLTDGFGSRRNPFGGKRLEFHSGQDIAAPAGTPVLVAAVGTVEFAGRMNGYGQVVIVNHGNDLHTRYGHLSRIDVQVGQLITKGEQIGCVGSTGRSTGPHLHYEVRVGETPVNPLTYLATAQSEGSDLNGQ